MNKKNFLLISFVILLFILCLFYFKFGYLPIIGKYIADYKIGEYSNQSVNSMYNLVNSGYDVNVNTNRKYTYFLNTDLIYDVNLNEKLNQEVNVRYSWFLEGVSDPIIKFPETVTVSVLVDAKNNEITYYKIYLLGIFEITDVSVEESKMKMCTYAEEVIKSLGINCTAIQMDYANKTGLFKLNYNSWNKKTPINYNELLKHIKQTDEKDLPINYLEWRELH